MTRLGWLSKGWFWLVVIISIALLLPSGNSAVQASLPADPLVLAWQGDIWTLARDGTLRQRTTWGLNDWPVISPDGTHVVYSSDATIFADWLRAIPGGTGGYQPPTNIWMLDLSSGRTSRIADQPADARWTGMNAPGKYVLRTTPTWSPDGQHLAWTEILIDTPHTLYELNGAKAQLVVWDMASQTIRVLVSGLAWEDPGELRLDVKWGRPGITMFLGAIPESFDEAHPFDEELRVYDPAGPLMTHLVIRGTYTMYRLEWIHAAGRDYLFDPSEPETTPWLDWQTAQKVPSAGAPEMYSLSAPTGASFFEINTDWMLAFPGQAPIDLGDHDTPYGISRDGQWVAYEHTVQDSTTGYDEPTIVIRSVDHISRRGPYTDLHAVLWGPVGWRVKGLR